jgi:WD40 repeat protein
MRSQNAQGMEVINQIPAPSGMGAAPDDSLYIAKADAADGKVELQSAKSDKTGCGSSLWADDIFDLKEGDLCTLRWTADGKTIAVPLASGQIIAKWDSTRTGKKYKGHIWTGSQGAAIQWLFDWGNDPGTADIIDAGDFVQVIKCPAWLADHASFGTVAADGDKYIAIAPIWAVIS